MFIVVIDHIVGAESDSGLEVGLTCPRCHNVHVVRISRIGRLAFACGKHEYGGQIEDWAIMRIYAQQHEVAVDGQIHRQV